MIGTKSTIYKDKKDVILQFYDMNKQNNISLIKSSVNVRNDRDDVYRKITEFIYLKRLNDDSDSDITDFFMTLLSKIVSYTSSIDGYKKLKILLIHY